MKKLSGDVKNLGFTMWKFVSWGMEKWNNIYGGSISTVDDNSGLISLTYSGFISMVHRGTISMG